MPRAKVKGKSKGKGRGKGKGKAGEVITFVRRYTKGCISLLLFFNSFTLDPVNSLHVDYIVIIFFKAGFPAPASFNYLNIYYSPGTKERYFKTFAPFLFFPF